MCGTTPAFFSCVLWRDVINIGSIEVERLSQDQLLPELFQVRPSTHTSDAIWIKRIERILFSLLLHFYLYSTDSYFATVVQNSGTRNAINDPINLMMILMPISCKTEVIILFLKKKDDYLIKLYSATLFPNSTVRNLGDIFYLDLSFGSHVKQISSSAFFHQ